MTSHFEASRSRSDTPHSVGLHWMCDQPIVGAINESTQHSLQTDIHTPDGIRAPLPSKRAAADPRLRPRGHRDRPIRFTCQIFWLTSRFKFNITCVSNLSSDVPIRTDLQHHFGILQSYALLSQQIKSVATWHFYISIKICVFPKQKALSQRILFCMVQHMLTGILREGVK
jgi:hypothetical protein